MGTRRVVTGDQEKWAVLCFAHGKPGEWEAFCADFDISVQGGTFHEVQRELEAAVTDYVQAALEESEADRARLLSRRAPFWRTLWWSFRVLATTWHYRDRGGHDTAASFPVALAA
jgi:GAF domain-containing protein